MKRDSPNPIGRIRLAPGQKKFWIVQCPECGERIYSHTTQWLSKSGTSTWFGPVMGKFQTRKRAKDVLHLHMNEHRGGLW